jgi:hypothetical protein
MGRLLFPPATVARVSSPSFVLEESPLLAQGKKVVVEFDGKGGSAFPAFIEYLDSGDCDDKKRGASFREMRIKDSHHAFSYWT